MRCVLLYSTVRGLGSASKPERYMSAALFEYVTHPSGIASSAGLVDAATARSAL